MSSDEAVKLSPQQKKLQKLGEQLRKLSFPTSPISIELAKWMASAIDNYLRDRNPAQADGTRTTKTDKAPRTLDVILGLSTSKRGAPGDPAKREMIAREIYALVKAGASWRRIAADVGARHPGNDERVTIKRIYQEHQIKLLAEEIDATWDDADPQGSGQK